jgi:hypothetical protein
LKTAPKFVWRLVFLSGAVTLMCSYAQAQDLEPRAYSAAPIGTNFASVAYGRTSGDVVLDPTLPITGASAQFNTSTLGYYHAFGLFGRQTSISAGMPYVWGSGQGVVNGIPDHIHRSGLGDLRLRLSFFLIGSPAEGPQEFRKRKHKTIVGTSLVVVAPLGQYDPDLLINIGSNRWAFKPDIGISKPLRSWILELDLGGWFFTQNSNFFNGKTLDQAPIGSAQGHVSYTFRPGLWLALDGTYYTGGRTHVDGVRQLNLQQNSRLGVTLALPLTRWQSLKFAYDRGATVRIGGNYTTVSATYQLRWQTRK